MLAAIARSFGPSAAHPVAYVEHDWGADEWSRGGYGGFPPPGVLVRFGVALAAPVGRVFWAGAETASEWRSGPTAGRFSTRPASGSASFPSCYPFLLAFNGPAALAMFALRLAAGKAGVFTDPDRFWPRIRRAFPYALALGVVGNAVYASATVGPQGDAPA